MRHLPLMLSLMLLSAFVSCTGADEPADRVVVDLDAEPDAGTAERLGLRREYPLAKLSSGRVEVYVYLPDAKEGYYRGHRFDWSGMIAQATCDGHTFFTELRSPHDPLKAEHACGPSEQFGKTTALAYGETKPGEEFIQIGVGHVRRPDEKAYSFFTDYEVPRPAGWRVTKTADGLRFEQELTDERGWGYRYVKTLKLSRDEPKLSVRHELCNTGRKRIDTDWYAHNTCLLDGRKVGPGYELSLEYETTTDVAKISGGQARAGDGGTVAFVRPVDKPFWVESIEPAADAPARARRTMRLSDSQSGAAVTFAVDADVFKLSLYCEPGLICPEQNVRIRVAPGESAVWTSSVIFSGSTPQRH